jgi:hypothetical protein
MMMMMKLWSMNKTYRIKVELMGYVGYATDEGALIPWSAMRQIMQGIQETKDHFELLAEEMKKWHNQIPDGEERLASIKRTHEVATQPFESIGSVNDAVARAEAYSRRKIVPVKRRQ